MPKFYKYTKTRITRNYADRNLNEDNINKKFNALLLKILANFYYLNLVSVSSIAFEIWNSFS